MRTVILVQARLGSTRFPGKILKEVMGRPLLEYQIERLQRVKNADEIIVATTTNKGDQPIVDLCNRLSCSFFRGSEKDVLSRIYHAAEKFKADCIVRVNSDCPLIDSDIVEKVINKYLDNLPNFDYVANILEPGYPIGMHTEVFSANALKIANEKAEDKTEREHVTPYIYRNKNQFRLSSVKYYKDLSRYRWTVDYVEDYELVKKIICELYPVKANFNMFDVLKVIEDNPKWFEINNQFKKQQTV
jgi:spore coat polysaccharide biosynthesis protein SpsF